MISTPPHSFNPSNWKIMGLNADQDRSILSVQPLELVGTVMLPVNILYMRCSECQWRTRGIKTCSTNPSLQKTKIWRNSWWASRGQTMLRTLQSPYRMQNIFTERTEGFCMQLLPGLRSFTSTSICSKRKDLVRHFGGSFYEWRWSTQNPPCSPCSLLKSKDSCTLLPWTSSGEIWPSNLTSKYGLAYTCVSAYGMPIRGSSWSQYHTVGC